MKSTYFELDDPRLPMNGIVQLNDAISQCENETLTETMELALENGYFLIDVSADGYLLEKLE